MENKKAIEVLNTLLEINNDRVEGYQKASEDIEDSSLRELFGEFIRTSRKCQNELVSEITNLGGTPTESTRTDGKLFRAWMGVKAALTGDDRKAILNSCEEGEEKAVEIYQEVIDEDMSHLSEQQRLMVTKQKSLIVTDYNKIKSLADTASVVS